MYVFESIYGTHESAFNPPPDPATVANAPKAQADYHEWMSTVAPYFKQRYRVLDRAAKIEFVLVAGTLWAVTAARKAYRECVAPSKQTLNAATLKEL
jgi:hypothetical protein